MNIWQFLKKFLKRCWDGWLGRPIIIAIGCMFVGQVILWIFPSLITLSDFFNLVGFIIGIYAAMEAARAESKAKESLDRLKETALIVGEAKNDFVAVFENFLLQPLQMARTKQVKAYLLLSTPAYGLPVLGSGRFENLMGALQGVCQGSEIEFIFFSPDAHIHHWVNTLLWSPSHSSNDQNFAVQYGEGIITMLNFLENSPFHWRLWITNEATIRLFAFEFMNGAEPPQVYLMLSDRVTIPVDQWESGGKGFKGRGFPILLPLAGDIIGQASSYFEQLKRCPYTLRQGEDACLRTTKRGDMVDMVEVEEKTRILLKHLCYDYVLGRTEQHIYDLDCFRYEMDRYIEEQKKLNITITDDKDILCAALIRICEYFEKFLSYSETLGRERFCPYLGQLLIVKMVGKFLTNLLDEQPLGNDQLRSAVGNLLAIIELPQVVGQSGDGDDVDIRVICNSPVGEFVERSVTKLPAWNAFCALHGGDENRAKTIIALKLMDIKDAYILVESGQVKDKLIFALYGLLSSGFRESAYAAKCRLAMASKSHNGGMANATKS
jgi:hypothetical protein